MELRTPEAPAIDELVLDDRVHRRIYCDPAIFEAEMERIFERVWVYVGHESEIAKPGDYRATRLGRQPVVLTRTEDGTVHVLVNRCTHRGSLICREERGNSTFFRCPYHAWTFRNDGRLIGVPRRQRYPADFPFAELDAVRVPRVELYRGLIFASFDPGVMPLEAWLAQTRAEIDAVLDIALDGTIRLSPGPNRHRYSGNWKFQMENGVDGYHAMYLHETFFEIQKRGRDSVRLAPRDEHIGWSQAYDNGHVLLARHAPEDEIARLRALFPAYFDALERKHGPGSVARLLRETHLFIFPNLFLTMNQIRVIHPLSHDRTLVVMDPFFLDGAPDALNEMRLREHQQGFTPGGFIVPDDYAAFEYVQQGMSATSVPWLYFARGIHDEELRPDGSRVGKPTDETTHRGMYRMYRQLMREGRA
jgi:benzoate/toluate 1,2-dioxygenase alpha subunit